MQAFFALRAEAFAVSILPLSQMFGRRMNDPEDSSKPTLNQLLSYIDLQNAFGR